MKVLLKAAAGALLFSACLVLTGIDSFAGTGIYIGKDVSKDGTIVLGESVEHLMGMSCMPEIYERGKLKKGDVISSMNGYEYTMPEDSAKLILEREMTYVGEGEYNCLAVNEYGVSVLAIISTDYNAEAVAADPLVEDGVSEEKLSLIVASTSKTAKEAVSLLCSLYEEKGAQCAEIVLIADQDGAWVVENFTGHQYVATKLPDDVMATFSNEPIIKTADPDDKNTICSPELFTLPEENGFAVTDENGDLDLILTYNYGNEYSHEQHIRGWVGHDLFAPSEGLKYDITEGYDVFFVPDEKVGITEAFDFFRNRFEGTPYELNLEEDSEYYGINNQYVGNANVVQIFDAVPAELSTVLWSSAGNPTASPFLPIPAITDSIPDSFSTDIVDDKYTEGLVQVDFARLNSKAVTRRNAYGASIKEYWEGMESISASDVAESITGRWYDTYKDSPEEAVDVIDDYVSDVIVSADDNCKRIEEELDWHMFRTGIMKSTVPDENIVPFECSFDVATYAHANGWVTTLDGDVFTATKDGKTIEIVIGGDSEGDITFTGFDTDELRSDFEEKGFVEVDENGKPEDLTEDAEEATEEPAEDKEEEKEEKEEAVEEKSETKKDTKTEDAKTDSKTEEKTESKTEDTTDEVTEEITKAAADKLEVNTIASLEKYFDEKIAAIPRDGWSEAEIGREFAEMSDDIVGIIGKYFTGDIEELIGKDYNKLGVDLATDPDVAKLGNKVVVTGEDLSALLVKYFDSLVGDVSDDVVKGRITQEGATQILMEAEAEVEGITRLYIEAVEGKFAQIFDTDLSEEEINELIDEIGEAAEVMDDYGVIDLESAGLKDGDLDNLSEKISDFTDADIEVVITLSEMDDDVLDSLSQLFGVDVKQTINDFLKTLPQNGYTTNVIEEKHEIEKADAQPAEEIEAVKELEETLSEDDIFIPQEVIDILEEAIKEAGGEDYLSENAADDVPEEETDGETFTLHLGSIESSNGSIMLPAYMLKYFE